MSTVLIFEFFLIARDVWKKRYFEEKKKTPPLEEQCSKLRQELDQLHKKIMTTLEGGKERDRRFPTEKPSEKVHVAMFECLLQLINYYQHCSFLYKLFLQSNLKIQATRLQHQLEDLQRRIENIKMKLTTEMKVRIIFLTSNSTLMIEKDHAFVCVRCSYATRQSRSSERFEPS